ncbi:unnamed protein product, partial [Prorocentrum cordatum]
MSKPVVNWFKSKADLDKALEEETSSVFVVEGEPEALPQDTPPGPATSGGGWTGTSSPLPRRARPCSRRTRPLLRLKD